MAEFRKITSEIDKAMSYTGRGIHGKFEGTFLAKYNWCLKRRGANGDRRRTVSSAD